MLLGNVLRHHCLRCGHDLKCDFTLPQQLSPFPERLELPYSFEKYLIRYLKILASSGSYHFTMWVKVNPHEVLAEHVVDSHRR